MWRRFLANLQKIFFSGKINNKMNQTNLRSIISRAHPMYTIANLKYGWGGRDGRGYQVRESVAKSIAQPDS